MRLAYKHVIIMDALTDLGLATARRLLLRGASVSLIDRDRAQLADAAASLVPLAAGDQQQVAIATADSAHNQDIQQAIEDLVRRNGQCDVLISMSRVQRSGAFAQAGPWVFEQAMATSYFGLVAAIQTVLPAMIARRNGALVAVTSLAGLDDARGYTAHLAARMAVRGLFEALNQELRPYHVRMSIAYLAMHDGLEAEQDHAASARLAQTLLNGITRSRFVITDSWRSSVLVRASRMLHPLLRRQLVRRQRPQPPAETPPPGP